MEYYGENDYRNYLSHHGILGMKWGDKNGPPYPLTGAAHSPAEKKMGWRKSLGGGRNEGLYDRLKKGVGNVKASIKTAKKKRIQKKNLEKAREAREKKRKEEAERQRILKKGSAAELYANRDKFDTKEINDAMNRINTDLKLKDLQTQEMLSKANEVKKVVDSVVGYGKTAISVYDTYAEVKKRIDAAKDKGTDPKLDKIIKSGDPKAILDNVSKMSDEELKRAAERTKNQSTVNAYLNAISGSSGNNNNKNNNSGSSNDEGRRKSPEERAQTTETKTTEASKKSETKSETKTTESSTPTPSNVTNEEAKKVRDIIDSKKNMTVNDLIAEGKASAYADYFSKRESKKKKQSESGEKQGESKSIKADVSPSMTKTVNELISEGKASAYKDLYTKKEKTNTEPVYKSEEAKAIKKVADSYMNKTVNELISEGRSSAYSDLRKKKKKETLRNVSDISRDERRFSPSERAGFNSKEKEEAVNRVVQSQLLRYYHELED